MRGFKSIIDQERPLRILTALLHNGTVPHALLFSGIEGVGKKDTAVALAMACNCLERNGENTAGTNNRQAEADQAGFDSISPAIPCGICKSCRKIDSGSHPDIILVQPTGAFIKIAQVRELLHVLAMKPYEASTRVVIINDAHCLNPAAGNALLKILEEPPQRTILILIATHVGGLLPTVVSRCQHIRFNPISSQKMVNLLVDKHGLNPGDARAIAIMARGSATRAVSMHKSNWIMRRNFILNEMTRLSSRPVRRLLALAHNFAKDKETFSETLEVITMWLRDAVIAKYCPEKIINHDIADEIRNASQKTQTVALLAHIDLVQSIQRRIHSNMNVRLSAEVMLMKLAKDK